VQNATVETRAVSSLARDVAGAGTGATPTWLGWRVPMVPGDRDVCSSWRDDQSYVRGTMLEPATGTVRPAFPAATGSTVALEAGTSLLILVRVIDGKVERLRTATDDCPLDAGGRRFVWLTAVSTAASLAYLETLVGPTALDTDTGERVARSAVGAIALHADGAADTILTRLLGAGSPAALRQEAVSWTARARGPSGRDRLIALVPREADASFRRTLVSAIGQTRAAAAAAFLKEIARTDRDAGVRGDALYWYAQSGGAPAIGDVIAIVQSEKEESVQRRGLSSVARLPAQAGIAPLIDLARRTPDAAVKRNAVRALSESTDPQAAAFMVELIRN
jgi:hypothetical protein